MRSQGVDRSGAAGSFLKWLLLSLCIGSPFFRTAVAQPSPYARNGTGATDQSTVETAPVMIDGEVLFRLRGVPSYSAEQRAESVSQAILDLAKDPTYIPGTLQVGSNEDSLTVVAGGRNIVVVTELDAAHERLSAPVLTRIFIKRIDTGIQDYRNARQPKALLRGAVYALALMVGFGIALLLFLRLSRVLGRLFQQSYEKGRRKTPADTLVAAEADSLWNIVSKIGRMLRFAIIGIAALFTLNVALAMFPWTRAFPRRVLDLVLDPLRTMGMGILGAIPDLAFLVMLFLVTRVFLRLAHLFFSAIDRQAIEMATFPAEWAMPTYRLVRILIVVFALVVGYPYMPGSNSMAFKGISLFLGLVFSLGSSGTTSNIVAGYSLTYRGAYHIGDLIQIDDVIGSVEKIRLQVTHLRTPKNEEVVIPNSQILNSNVKNYSSLVKQHRLILHSTLNVGYEVSWRQVESMLLLAAQRTEQLLSDPGPFVLLKELAEYAVTYEINVYCDQPHRMPWLYAELHRNVLDVFNEYGVQIMTPSYEADPENPKLVAKEKWFEKPAELLESLRQPSSPNPVPAIRKPA